MPPPVTVKVYSNTRKFIPKRRPFQQLNRQIAFEELHETVKPTPKENLKAEEKEEEENKLNLKEIQPDQCSLFQTELDNLRHSPEEISKKPTVKNRLKCHKQFKHPLVVQYLKKISNLIKNNESPTPIWTSTPLQLGHKPENKTIVSPTEQYLSVGSPNSQDDQTLVSTDNSAHEFFYGFPFFYWENLQTDEFPSSEIEVEPETGPFYGFPTGNWESRRKSENSTFDSQVPTGSIEFSGKSSSLKSENSRRLTYVVTPKTSTALDAVKGVEDLRDMIDPEFEVTSPARTIAERLDVQKSDQTLPYDQVVLLPGKKFKRSLSIIRNLDENMISREMTRKGRRYSLSVQEIIQLQNTHDQGNLTKTHGRRFTTIPLQSKSSIYFPDEAQLTILQTTIADLTCQQLELNSTSVPCDRSVRGADPSSYDSVVFMLCNQEQPCTFDDVLQPESFTGAVKVGEGVYGEVFIMSRPDQQTVLKVVPIEGESIVNGEKQKKYSEIYSELLIAKVWMNGNDNVSASVHLIKAVLVNQWLNYLRDDNYHRTDGFTELINSWVVKGSYPSQLILLWEEFDELKGSDNDHPKVFESDQLYLAMEFNNCGTDMESFHFSTAKQSISAFKQIAFTLAVAEAAFKFEHRDLHWGNILLSKTSEKQLTYYLAGVQYTVPVHGVKVAIIDYTLSRITYQEHFPVYSDLAQDPELFLATGDYQFEVYRLMKEDLGNDWSRFEPKTNVRWLYYVLDKLIHHVKYQRKGAKIHREALDQLRRIEKWIQDCVSALDVALTLTEDDKLRGT